MKTLPIPDVLDNTGPSWRDTLARCPWDSFCTVSLHNWLGAARDADVAIVPATEIWRGAVESIIKYDQKGPHEAELTAMATAIAQAGAPRIMLRWDCCAGYDVKGRLGNGQPGWHESFAQLYIDDPRAFDLIYEYPRDEMIVWSRPWIDAAHHDGYPIEFRLFVRDSEVIGASNYYPQMDLPEAFTEQASEAMCLTQRLIKAVRPPVWVPHDGGASRWAQDKVHGTVDWLLKPDGELLFLEGGPPFGAGAHPCCFLGADRVEGIALKTSAPKDELHPAYPHPTCLTDIVPAPKVV